MVLFFNLSNRNPSFTTAAEGFLDNLKISSSFVRKKIGFGLINTQDPSSIVPRNVCIAIRPSQAQKSMKYLEEDINMVSKIILTISSYKKEYAYV
jgi:hypothetical protein